MIFYNKMELKTVIRKFYVQTAINILCSVVNCTNDCTIVVIKIQVL